MLLMMMEGGGVSQGWDDSAKLREEEAVCCLVPLDQPYKVRYHIDRDAKIGQLVDAEGRPLDKAGASNFISRFLRLPGAWIHALAMSEIPGWSDWAQVEADPVGALQQLCDFILDDHMIR